MGRDKSERRLTPRATEIINKLLSDGYSLELSPMRVDVKPTTVPVQTGPIPAKALPVKPGICPGIKITKVTRKVVSDESDVSGNHNIRRN